MPKLVTGNWQPFFQAFPAINIPANGSALLNVVASLAPYGDVDAVDVSALQLNVSPNVSGVQIISAVGGLGLDAGDGTVLVALPLTLQFASTLITPAGAFAGFMPPSPLVPGRVLARIREGLAGIGYNPTLIQHNNLTAVFILSLSSTAAAIVTPDVHGAFRVVKDLGV